MHTNIIIALDTRRAKEDGTFPLILRLGHNRRTLPIPLNISLLEKDWDEEKRIIRKSYTSTDSVVRLNNYIQKKKANALDILQKLDEQGDLLKLTIVQIKQKIVRDSTANSFFDYTDDLILNLKKTKRFGTARSYQGVSNVLRSFNKRKDLTFNQITYNFLLKLETDHLGKDGNGYNGLAVYMRTIRAIYNKAIKAGLVDKELYPFNDYKIKTEPTRKRAINFELLRRIIGQDFQQDHLLFNARNYFLSSYMMYGMNFFDMAFLSDENIVDGRILYQRGKTSKLYDIKITPVLAEVLSYYKQNRQPGSKMLFPMADAETLEAKHKSILWARKRYNAKLKMLAELCEIKQKLTSYVSRHTFATQAMLQEIPVKAISTMLGHSSVKTTEIYLDSLPSNILDEYNEKILVLA